MNTLAGVASYSPNGPHGTNPAAAYSERAGTNASPAPHSRLTRRTPRAAATETRWSTSARPTPRPPGSGRRVHRLQLGVIRVELLEGADTEQLAVDTHAAERDGRVECIVGVEHVDALGRHDAAGKHAVLL
jgi:hypothetical protein